ncbi:MAG: metallopeptidase family protein [Candidatus Vogelbacteria bacterium]|nr:metallopeptidase family protein [Candidatus Vogelbacteria bacterium]
MTHEAFEQLVEEGIAAIPERFLKMLKNVRIVVEDEPSPAQLAAGRVGRGYTLFGLYEGVPQPARNGSYNLMLPDKITIFRQPIENACATDDEIRAQVKETVWHEIAHHFGFDESAVAERSAQKRKNQR